MEPTDVKERIAELLRNRAGTAGHHLDPYDTSRFEAILRELGSPPASVLDVGCGTGVATDVASSLGFDAVGVDTDAEAMAVMEAPQHVASVAALPFGDSTFDIVLASEVLEHLPAPIFGQALAELSRVAAQSVVLTVPNSESLESASTRCPKCFCIYSIHGHVRRFKRQDMADLLPNFRLAAIREIGPYKLRHRSIEWFFRRRLLGRWPAAPGTVCPQCHARQGSIRRTDGVAQTSRVRRAAMFLAGYPWHRWWLLARYERIT